MYSPTLGVTVVLDIEQLTHKTINIVTNSPKVFCKLISLGFKICNLHC